MNFSTFAKALLSTSLLALTLSSAQALEVQKPVQIKKLNIQKPARAVPKADLIVYLVDEDYGQQHLMRVTIRNNGNAKSGSAILRANDMSQPGLKAEGSIPSIQPNGVRNIDLKFSQLPKKGDRIRIIADAGNHVNESNEKNNIKFINY
jgi:hypothetical protein